MSFRAGLYGGNSESLDSTVIVEDINLDKNISPYSQEQQAETRIKETNESKLLSGEIGIKCSAISNEFESANWTEREDFQIIYSPATSDSGLVINSCSRAKPLLRAAKVLIYRKIVTGNFVLYWDGISNPSGIPSGLRIDGNNPFATIGAYTISSDVDSPNATVTIPSGSYIKQRSQSTSRELATTDFSFEFETSNTDALISTHLLLFDNALSSGQGIADFGDGSVSNNDGTMYTLERNFTLSNTSEASVDQIIRVYDSSNYY